MKKRIISVLLAVITVLSLVTVTSFAENETVYPVWISGIQVTKSNMTDVFGSADGDAKSVTFNPDTKTLTLKNAKICETGTATGFGYGDNVCGVKSELDTLNVNIIGDCKIGKEVSAESGMEDYSVDVGFSCTGNITFSGDKDSSMVIYDYSAGIIAKNVTFKENFKGRFTVRDCGGAEPQPPCVINAVGTFDDGTGDYIRDGVVSILGGTLDFISYCSNGISAAGNITVQNSDLSVVSDYSAIENIAGDITVKDSKLTAVGDTAINCSNGNILIDNVNLKAASDGCEGIYGTKEITFTDCPAVDIFGADEAVYAYEKINFINCPYVKLESNQLNTVCADSIVIDNSNLNVTANHGYSGLIAKDETKGNITIKNSKLTIKAEGSGIWCDNLSVSGAKTEVYSVGDTDSDGKGCGVIIEGNESAISVTDSTVKFTGGEAGIKLQMKSDENPFGGSLPNVGFMGNKAFDTFDSLGEVNYRSEKNDGYGTFSEYAYVGDEIAKSVAVNHIHSPIKVDGVAATTERAGFKSYYKCDCGRYFEDAKAGDEITDIDEWKAEGGRGYLPKIAKPEEPNPEKPEQKETKPEESKQEEPEQKETEQGEVKEKDNESEKTEQPETEQKESENKENEQKSPKTKDTRNMTLWICLLYVAFAGISCFGIRGIVKYKANR